MKKYLVILFSAMILNSCGSAGNEKTVTKEEKKDSIVENPVSKSLSKPVTLNEEAFRQKVHDFVNKKEWKYLGDKPCIVDFYADWCAPCRRLAPILEELAQEYSEKIYIYKVNTDHNQKVSAHFNITGIPAVMMCPMEGQPQMMVGLYPKDDYKKAIKDVLKVIE